MILILVRLGCLLNELKRKDAEILLSQESQGVVPGPIAAEKIQLENELGQLQIKKAEFAAYVSSLNKKVCNHSQ